ncbi:Fe2+-dependent dioxygenase [Polymorphobacter sp.]|uniref:Fe2+-dependent dioxygenase n=1 Tax=Polymorphobacter sp. TaxID=1909290 RepID=UPI003F729269
MLIEIPAVLDAAGIAEVRGVIDEGEWVDGNVTSGHQSALAKHNTQLVEASPAARKAGGLILDALGRTPLFIAAALPHSIYPPLFNRYQGGQAFGNHVDNAVRIQRGSNFRIRSDLSATLFLEDPESYDGGELLIEHNFGTQAVKLPAGHMVLYPASSVHRVAPVTRGRRTASFFWLQSMVRDTESRQLLFGLDTAIQQVAQTLGHSDETVIRMTGIYHNLLRKWTDL